jgi:hypothetical protein
MKFKQIARKNLVIGETYFDIPNPVKGVELTFKERHSKRLVFAPDDLIACHEAGYDDINGFIEFTADNDLCGFYQPIQN